MSSDIGDSQGRHLLAAPNFCVCHIPVPRYVTSISKILLINPLTSEITEYLVEKHCFTDILFLINQYFLSAVQ